MTPDTTLRLSRRVTDEPAELRQFDSRIARYFSGGASFQSSELLVATWDGVGYYNSRADKVGRRGGRNAVMRDPGQRVTCVYVRRWQE